MLLLALYVFIGLFAHLSVYEQDCSNIVDEFS